MAQQIITLAKEETSQDILTRVRNLEADMALMKPAALRAGGGIRM